MPLMNVREVAEFLNIQEIRVQRLERESLLSATQTTEEGEPLFDKSAVEK